MATHMEESRKAVRHYLHQQWITMVTSLGNPAAGSADKKNKARANFVAFEEALSFPYNQKLAYFPADNSIEDTTGTGRARGEFGAGSLLIESLGGMPPSHKELAAHQSAMLASLYARQEFIRAAARMPMTLFVGPDIKLNIHKFPTEKILLTSEKFSRVVFSGITENFDQYVAVVQLSQTYPQSGVVRVWWTHDPNHKKSAARPDWILIDMKTRWEEIAGEDGTVGNILFQRGSIDTGIPLRTRGLDNEDSAGMYIKHVDTAADMWANVMALTASGKHGDTNLWKKDAEKLWGTLGGTDHMEGWQWMAAMLALRRIPYIVKSENADDANRDPLPHALTHDEAETVKIMMGDIIKARRGAGNPGQSSSNQPANNKLGSHQKQRLVFSETAKWW